MCAHILFTGSGFEELKIIREAEVDGNELMKQASELFVEAMTKTLEVESSPVGSETFDASTGDRTFDENSIVPPSSRLENFKKRRHDKRKSRASSSSEQRKEDRIKQAFHGCMEVVHQFDAVHELKYSTLG